MDELEVFLSEKHSGQDADFDEVHDPQLRFKKKWNQLTLRVNKGKRDTKTWMIENHCKLKQKDEKRLSLKWSVQGVENYKLTDGNSRKPTVTSHAIRS